MNLETVNQWVQIINGIASTIGIIVGAIWVYSRYIYHRTDKWNLKLDIGASTIQQDKNNCLLKLCLTLRNEGNIKITPGPKGCRLTVRKLDRDPGNKPMIDLDAGEPIINEHDMLIKYLRPGIGYKMYEIEPKVEYHELVAVPVSKGDLLSIRAEFFWKDNSDSITEYSLYCVE